MTLAEEEEQQLELQADWQMADVLHFIIVFLRDIPGLMHMDWTANALESNLITSTGGPGLLTTLHMVCPSCRMWPCTDGPVLQNSSCHVNGCLHYMYI